MIGEFGGDQTKVESWEGVGCVRLGPNRSHSPIERRVHDDHVRNLDSCDHRNIRVRRADTVGPSVSAVLPIKAASLSENQTKRALAECTDLRTPMSVVEYIAYIIGIPSSSFPCLFPPHPLSLSRPHTTKHAFTCGFVHPEVVPTVGRPSGEARATEW